MAPRKKILIIEDDTDLIEAMKVTLRAENYKVISSTDPEKGFVAAKKEKPDIVILDVLFGKDDKAKGFDYAVKMRSEKTLSSIPILMVTSINVRYPEFKFSPDTDGEFLPVDDFIDKPAKPKELVDKVKKLIDAKVSKWAK